MDGRVLWRRILWKIETKLENGKVEHRTNTKLPRRRVLRDLVPCFSSPGRASSNRISSSTEHVEDISQARKLRLASRHSLDSTTNRARERGYRKQTTERNSQFEKEAGNMFHVCNEEVATITTRSGPEGPSPLMNVTIISAPLNDDHISPSGMTSETVGSYRRSERCFKFVRHLPVRCRGRWKTASNLPGSKVAHLLQNKGLKAEY